MLPYFYSLEIAGLYGMAIRILEQPIRLIATSTLKVSIIKKRQNVFKQKLALQSLL